MTSYQKIVYNNSITESHKHSRNKVAYSTSVEKKPISMKCNNCAWSTTGARKHPNVVYTMKRIYVRRKGRWIPIGWYCRHCGSVVLDRLAKPSHGFFHPPDPTIMVLEQNTRNGDV